MKAWLSLEAVDFYVQDKTLIEGVSLSVHEGDVISLIGPNGAGKSTLIKLMLGLLKPTKGSAKKHPNALVGYVPQKFAVPAILPLTVQDLLKQAHPTRLTHAQKQTVIELFFLTSLLKQQVAALSGGELQRVLLAKALLDKPDVLVLDEPMQGLDPDAQTLLYQRIDALPDFLKCAMLVVSHDLHWVMKGTKEVVCLNKHICCQGKPAQIAQDANFIALFGQHTHQTPYIHQHDHCSHLS